MKTKSMRQLSSPAGCPGGGLNSGSNLSGISAPSKIRSLYMPFSKRPSLICARFNCSFLLITFLETFKKKQRINRKKRLKEKGDIFQYSTAIDKRTF